MHINGDLGFLGLPAGLCLCYPLHNCTQEKLMFSLMVR